MRLLLASAFMVLGIVAAQAQQCGLYSIGGCFTSRFNAEQRVLRVGGRIINTNNYSNFTPGYYCVVRGPFSSPGAADNGAANFRLSGVHDAYVKNSCYDH